MIYEEKPYYKTESFPTRLWKFLKTNKNVNHYDFVDNGFIIKNGSEQMFMNELIRFRICDTNKLENLNRTINSWGFKTNHNKDFKVYLHVSGNFNHKDIKDVIKITRRSSPRDERRKKGKKIELSSDSQISDLDDDSSSTVQINDNELKDLSKLLCFFSETNNN